MTKYINRTMAFLVFILISAYSYAESESGTGGETIAENTEATGIATSIWQWLVSSYPF